MDVSSIMGSFRKGYYLGYKLYPIIIYECLVLYHNLVSHEACHGLSDAFIESINEDDYKNAVFQVVNGPEKSSNDKGPDDNILKLISKIYKTLEDSPVSILPFIQSCTRNAN